VNLAVAGCLTRRPYAWDLRFDSISALSHPNNAPYEFLTNLSGLFSLCAPILSLSGLHILASPGEVPMSLTVFLAFCILGCDFLLYALFQWIYGEKHRDHARRSAARRERRRTLSAKEAGEPSVLSFPQRPIHHRTGYF